MDICNLVHSQPILVYSIVQVMVWHNLLWAFLIYTVRLLWLWVPHNLLSCLELKEKDTFFANKTAYIDLIHTQIFSFLWWASDRYNQIYMWSCNPCRLFSCFGQEFYTLRWAKHNSLIYTNRSLWCENIFVAHQTCIQLLIHSWKKRSWSIANLNWDSKINILQDREN